MVANSSFVNLCIITFLHNIHFTLSYIHSNLTAKLYRILSVNSTTAHPSQHKNKGFLTLSSQAKQPRDIINVRKPFIYRLFSFKNSVREHCIIPNYAFLILSAHFPCTKWCDRFEVRLHIYSMAFVFIFSFSSNSSLVKPNRIWS